MKVLLANKFFFRNGGSEAVMFDERRLLKEANVDVVDFSMADERNIASDHTEWFVDNQSYQEQSGSKLGQLTTALKFVHSGEAVSKIESLIKATKPDLIHCHNIYHQLTPSIIRAAKRLGVPSVLTLHDYKPVCPVYTKLRNGALCGDCAGNNFRHVVKNRCADGSLVNSALMYVEAKTHQWLKSYESLDLLIAPSKFMRDTVVEARFAPDKVEVLYNGVDCDKITPATSDQGYALYLGRLSQEKGISTLLEAHSRLPNLELRIAGTGPLAEELQTRHPNAKFLGHVSGSELEQTIANAAVVVVPSEWHENCPMSVLEAMAYGKPVIGSDLGGIPELVDHEQTGLIFPYGDVETLVRQLAHSMADPKQRQSWGLEARQRAEQKFSLEQHGLRLVQLYQQVLDR